MFNDSVRAQFKHAKSRRKDRRSVTASAVQLTFFIAALTYEEKRQAAVRAAAQEKPPIEAPVQVTEV